MAATRKILFVTPPGYGHTLPAVPLAWALKAAGHQVLLATCGISVSAAEQAGLSVFDVAPGVGLSTFQSLRKEFRFAQSSNPRGEPQTNEPASGRVLSELGDAMIDGLVAAMDSYRAHLIVYTPAATAAPVLAAKFQAPAIFLGIGLAQTPDRMVENISSRMSSACERHGVTKISAPATWIDVAPPSLRGSRATGLPMRYVPYSRGGVITAGFFRKPDRPLVAVTLGTVVPLVLGTDLLRSITAAVTDIDADFVFAHGSTDIGLTGKLPSNLHVIPWTAFDSLFRKCSAVVHHGGSGTTMTALDAALPQIIMPHGADQFYNAAALARRGVALVPGNTIASAGELRRLVTDEGLRTAALELSEEMAAMAPPADLVPGIAAMAA